MRIPWMAFFVPIVGLLIDWYIYRAMRRAGARRGLVVAHWCLAVIFNLDLAVSMMLPGAITDNGALLWLMWTLYAYYTVYGSKLLFVICDAIGRLFSRRRRRERGLRGQPVMTKVGIVVAIISFLTMWWGALINRFNTQVTETQVPIAVLPDDFEGYRVVQISDLHVGTYLNDTTFVSRVVDQINALQPDLIVFTGDIVNRQSNELQPFVPVLGRLRATDGVYSILGNHDYGDYMKWATPAQRQADNQKLYDMEAAMGWKLLKNQTDTLRRGDSRLLLIGMENLGDPPFKVYGDLQKAYATPGDDEVKIMLSHTPAHWTDSVANNPEHNIALTLSGHTHAMQMEAFGLSPARLRYKNWGGLYTDTLGQNLYVNIGLGTVGMPMRIGATPEISVLTLTKTK